MVASPPWVLISKGTQLCIKLASQESPLLMSLTWSELYLPGLGLEIPQLAKTNFQNPM